VISRVHKRKITVYSYRCGGSI